MMPKLRFKEFDYPWDKKTLGDIFTISSGGTPNRNTPEFWVGGTIPWITTSLINFNIINAANEFVTPSAVKKSSAKIFPINTILIAMYGQGKTRGKCAVLGIEATTNQACAALIPAADINTQFTFQYISGRYDEIREMSNSGGQENISIGIIKKISIVLPDLKEQTKIAGFLSCIDEKITLLSKQHDLLCQFKKGMMQKIFSQELRFESKNPYPEWKTVLLADCLYEHKQRNKNLFYTRNNVLSVSGDVGVVNQIELLGRSYAGESIANYHIVNSGDVVYTKSPLKENPYGIIKSNKGAPGVVSTLYAVYRCNRNIDHRFVDYYFSRKEVLNNYLKPLVNKGAKNDMKVNNLHVLSGSIILPSFEEQKVIVAFLSVLDDKITTKKTELDKLKIWKQGLLQQMFV